MNKPNRESCRQEKNIKRKKRRKMFTFLIFFQDTHRESLFLHCAFNHLIRHIALLDIPKGELNKGVWLAKAKEKNWEGKQPELSLCVILTAWNSYFSEGIQVNVWFHMSCRIFFVGHTLSYHKKTFVAMFYQKSNRYACFFINRNL